MSLRIEVLSGLGDKAPAGLMIEAGGTLDPGNRLPGSVAWTLMPR